MLCRGTPSAKEQLPFTDGRFDALATCYLDGLRVREGGRVGTKSALEANGSQEDFVVSPVVRSSAKCSALRVHAAHPYSRVSITSAFSTRTFSLSGAVVLSYNSGPNR